MKFSNVGGVDNDAMADQQSSHTNITNVNNNINFYGPVVNHVYTTSSIPTKTATTPLMPASPILIP